MSETISAATSGAHARHILKEQSSVDSQWGAGHRWSGLHGPV